MTLNVDCSACIPKAQQWLEQMLTMRMINYMVYSIPSLRIQTSIISSDTFCLEKQADFEKWMKQPVFVTYMLWRRDLTRLFGVNSIHH